MRRRVLSALVCALLLSLVTPVAPAPAGADAGAEGQFVAAVNAARAQGGLPPLEVDGELTGLARSWAQYQADGSCPPKQDGSPSRICHAGKISTGVTADWYVLGENVGVGPDVGSIMDAFIASPRHYENIMDPRFTRIGVGVVWNGAELYTTHRFMQMASDRAGAEAPAEQVPRAPRATPPAEPAAPAEPPPPPVPDFPPPPTAVPSRVAVVLAALRSAPL